LILNNEISAIPELPEGLREAAVRGTLVPFVGAGASRIAGCPTWSQFADGALRSFISQGKFSHAQLDQIRDLNPRIKMSIALSLQKSHSIPLDFEALLYPTGKKDNVKGQKLYGALSKLGRTFVTTNYDEWLHRVINLPEQTITPLAATISPPIQVPRNVFYEIDDLTFDNLVKPNTVVHLHGSLVNPHGMVLTTPHYVTHSANDRWFGGASGENKVLTFLDNLFQRRTVLFVGYGLDELEILEYIIVKRRPSGTSVGEIKHFMLQGYFSHEQELMTNLSFYYADFGIQLIPFLRDHKDWDQLIDVLDDFARKAPASDPMKLQTLADMEKLLND
jgi:hypothetical protein